GVKLSGKRTEKGEKSRLFSVLFIWMARLLEESIMNTNINANRATLLISCPERPGIISTVSNFLLEHKANIVHFDQHTTDPLAGIFFMRIEFDMNDFDESFSKLKEDLPEMAREYSMEWKLSGKGERK